MRHNGRAPILASQMRPEHLSLREGEPRLAVCPDCETWHRLKRGMIHPHRDGSPVERTERRYYGDKPAGGRRCPGSAQRITIDITPEEWAEKLLAADSTATGRRSARQHHKPVLAPAAPLARIHADVTPATARRAYLAHTEECVPCGTGEQCMQGGALAQRYIRVLREEPARRQARKKTAPDARRAQWAKHGGADVETANNQNRPRPHGTVSDYRGPQVPTTPLRINA